MYLQGQVVLQGGYPCKAGYLNYSLTSSQKGQNRSTTESVTTFTWLTFLLCSVSFVLSWGIYYITPHYLGNKGWCSGESARLPPMWPGFRSWCRRHMWVEFVVGSLLCSERFFSAYSGFPLSSKSNISKLQFDKESGRRRTTLWTCYLQINIYFYFIIHCLKSLWRLWL